MKQIKQLYIWSVLVCAMAGTAVAQTPDTLLRAAEAHPQVRMAWQHYEAAKAAAGGEGYLPDPQLGMGYFIQPIETRVGPQRLRLSLSQPFPWPGTLRVQRQQAAASAELAWFVYRDRLAQQQEEVSLVWQQRLAAQELLQLRQDELRLLQLAEHTLLSQYGSGLQPLTAVLSLQAEIASGEAAIARQQVALESINQLLRLRSGWPEDQALPVPTQQLQLQWEEDHPRFEQHPAATALYHKEQATRALEQLSKLAGRPQWQAGVDYVVTAPGPDPSLQNNGRNGIAPTISLSIPLYGKKYKAGRVAAAARHKAVIEEQATLLNQLRQRWVSAKEMYQQAAADHTLASAQLQRYAQITRLGEEAMANDSGDLLELLRYRQQAYHWRRELVDALLRQNMALLHITYLRTNPN